MRPLPNVDVISDDQIRNLHAWMTRHTDELVRDLVALAERETPSDDLALLNTGADYLDGWIVERIGVPERRERHRSEVFGPVLVMDYPGASLNRVTVLAHFDTVFPSGTTQSWPVRTNGALVTGPGVFDMKSGLVQMIWAIKGLDGLGIRRPAIRIVLNSDEEIGSPFSRPILEQASLGSEAVLVFEGSANHGAIKTARKGVGLFTVTAEGLEAHAGLDPEAGVSAIDEIARVIRHLHDGADLSQGTSINVGTLHGGTRANVIAGAATANLDVRVSSASEQSRVDNLLISLTAHHPRAKITVSGGWNRPIMSRTEENVAMYDLARAVAHRLGADLREASVGGASDGNFVAALGLPVLDGLGGVGSGAHARHENISIPAMPQRAALAAAVIAAFSASSDHDGAPSSPTVNLWHRQPTTPAMQAARTRCPPDTGKAH